MLFQEWLEKTPGYGFQIKHSKKGPAALPALIGAGGMMGAAALSRGGSGGGGGGGFGQVATLRPGQRDLLDQLTTLLQGQLGTGVKAWPAGERVAPVSPFQQQAFDIMGGYAPLAGEGQSILQDVMGRFSPETAQGYQQMGGEALQRTLAPYDPTAALQSLEPARQMALQTFREDVVPWLKERSVAATGTGQSGALQRELARAGERLGLGISAQALPLVYQGGEAAKQRTLQAIPEAYRMGTMGTDVMNAILGGVGQLPGNIMQQLTALGGTQRGITGEQMQAQQRKWTETQPYENPWLGMLSAALGTPAVVPFYQQPQPSLASLMAPAFGQMLGGQGFQNWMGGLGSQVQTPAGWNRGVVPGTGWGGGYLG